LVLDLRECDQAVTTVFLANRLRATKAAAAAPNRSTIGGAGTGAGGPPVDPVLPPVEPVLPPVEPVLPPVEPPLLLQPPVEPQPPLLPQPWLLDP
jgi:hypothetical protein